MAKKATDLLDVFHLGAAEQAPSTSRRRTGSMRKTKGRRNAAHASEGLFLARRQVLLASSVFVLLLVLAFTVGLGVGRHGAHTARTALDRTTTTVWVLRARIDRYDAIRSRHITYEDLLRALEQGGIPPSSVRVDADAEDAFAVLVGPFADEAQARTWRKNSGIDRVRIGNQSPFRFAQVVRASWP